MLANECLVRVQHPIFPINKIGNYDLDWVAAEVSTNVHHHQITPRKQTMDLHACPYMAHLYNG